MIAAKVACPNCRTVLKLSSELGAGQTVKCPKCGTPFAVGTNGVKNAPRQAPAAPEGQAFGGLEDDEEEPDFSTLGATVRSRSKGSKIGMFVVVLLALGLAGLGVAVAVQRLNETKGKDENRNEKPLLKNDEEEPGKDGGQVPVKNKEASGPKGFHVPLPPATQEKVNKGVDAGIQYLKKAQAADGRWVFTGPANGRFHIDSRNQVGLTALPGLTLLECGVPKTDPVIQKAAAFIREHCPKLDQTYDISLAVLFLDRLGEAGDKALIGTLVMRLVAGQTDNGGWSYTCPVLSADDQNQLAAVIRKMPGFNKLDLVETPKKPDPHNKLVLDEGKDPNENTSSSAKLILDSPDPAKDVLEARGKLPKNLQNLPVLQTQPPLGTQPQDSDNSNTQFATLALWAAREYDLPLDRTIALLVKRFRTSQFYNGAWRYGYDYTVGMPDAEQKKRNWVGRHTMTCAGLLGLAVGHGMALELKNPVAKDPAVQKGLKALGRALDYQRLIYAKPTQKSYNMYLLWSVERVGVIYEVRRIGQTDWYTWGVDYLLPRQEKDGSWYGGPKGFHGASPTVDTSLALLFLKRVNLAKGLQSKLILDDNE